MLAEKGLEEGKERNGIHGLLFLVIVEVYRKNFRNFWKCILKTFSN
jgi:hypothetical protein